MSDRIALMPPTDFSKPRENFDVENLNISFNGCGFLGVYHVGVACALNHYMPNMKIKNICGASAGAMAAVCLIAGVPSDEMTSDLMKAGNDIRHTLFGAFSPTQNVTHKLRTSLERLLPDNIHELANGKLHISATDVYTGKNVLIKNYRDKKEVIDAVITSTFIPYFSGLLPPRYRKRRFIDGGFSVNQVILEDDQHATLTVSPFSGDAHICPKVKRRYKTAYTRLQFAEAWTDLSLENFERMKNVVFPPSPEDMSKIILAGYHDAVAFLGRYRMIQTYSCSTCLTVKTTFSPKDVLKEEEEYNKKNTTSSKQTKPGVNRVYSNDLLKSLKTVEEVPDKILPEFRYKFMGVMMPTLNEVLYDYNPYFHASKFCISCTANIMQRGFGFVQKAVPIIPDWNVILHTAEDTMSNCIGILAPKVFGIKTAKVLPTECEDENAQMKEKAKFSCEFHITQDDGDSEDEDYSDEEFDAEDVNEEDLDTSTLMSVHLDTFLEKRDMPSTHTDAMRLQAENLEEAVHSNVASRVTSRINSIAPSLIASAIQSRRGSIKQSCLGSSSASRRGSLGPAALGLGLNPPPGQFSNSNTVEAEGSPETLENLVRVTQNQESIFQAYYTNDSGEVVTMSVYDISTTDPADILGNDIIAQNEFEQSNIGNSNPSGTTTEFGVDSKLEAVSRELKKHQRRRSLQISGDSFNGSMST